jgi:hypothetical protein
VGSWPVVAALVLRQTLGRLRRVMGVAPTSATERRLGRRQPCRVIRRFCGVNGGHRTSCAPIASAAHGPRKLPRSGSHLSALHWRRTQRSGACNKGYQLFEPGPKRPWDRTAKRRKPARVRRIQAAHEANADRVDEIAKEDGQDQCQ